MPIVDRESAMTKPVLVFDGDCGFCRFWIARWQCRTGDRLEYQPYQSDEIARRFPDLSRERCSRAVQLVGRADFGPSIC